MIEQFQLSEKLFKAYQHFAFNDSLGDDFDCSEEDVIWFLENPEAESLRTALKENADAYFEENRKRCIPYGTYFPFFRTLSASLLNFEIAKAKEISELKAIWKRLNTENLADENCKAFFSNPRVNESVFEILEIDATKHTGKLNGILYYTIKNRTRIWTILACSKLMLNLYVENYSEFTVLFGPERSGDSIIDLISAPLGYKKIVYKALMQLDFESTCFGSGDINEYFETRKNVYNYNLLMQNFVWWLGQKGKKFSISNASELQKIIKVLTRSIYAAHVFCFLRAIGLFQSAMEYCSAPDEPAPIFEFLDIIEFANENKFIEDCFSKNLFKNISDETLAKHFFKLLPHLSPENINAGISRLINGKKKSAQSLFNDFLNSSPKLPPDTIKLLLIHDLVKDQIGISAENIIPRLNEHGLPWYYLANSKTALDQLTNQVRADQDHSILRALTGCAGDDNDKKIVLKAILQAYSERPHSRFRLSCFNRLGDSKRNLAKQSAQSSQDFQQLYTHVKSQHENLARKANKFWLFSNRWKKRTESMSSTLGAPPVKWDENEHSTLGVILKSFKS
jgi:hypothetical protein